MHAHARTYAYRHIHIRIRVQTHTHSYSSLGMRDKHDKYTKKLSYEKGTTKGRYHTHHRTHTHINAHSHTHVTHTHTMSHRSLLLFDLSLSISHIHKYGRIHTQVNDTDVNIESLRLLMPEDSFEDPALMQADAHILTHI